MAVNTQDLINPQPGDVRDQLTGDFVPGPENLIETDIGAGGVQVTRAPASGGGNSDPLFTANFDQVLQDAIAASGETQPGKLSGKPIPGAQPGQPQTVGQAKDVIKARLDQVGYFQNLYDRFKYGLGQTPEARLNAVQQRYGKGGARLNGDLVEVKNSKGEWVNFDESEFTVADFFDLSGDIIEGVVSTAIEAGVFAATAPTTGPGALAWTAASAVPAGMVGSAVRGEVAEAFGVNDPDMSKFDEAYKAGLYNLAGVGLGAVVGKTLSIAKNKLFPAIMNAIPERRLENVAQIQKAVDEIGKKLGFSDIQREEAGQTIFNAVDKAKDRMGKQVGLLKEEAREVAGEGMKFAPRDFLQGVADTFRDRNVRIDADTMRATIGRNTTAGIRDPRGLEVLQVAVDEYNDILDKYIRKGGLTIDEMFDISDRWGGMIDAFNAERRPGAAKLLNDLYQRMANDKNETIAKVLSTSRGTTYEAARREVDQAMRAYATNIDEIRDLTKVWKSSKENGEIFMDSLVKKGNNTRLESLKRILGEDSDDWKLLKSTFVNDKIERAVDPAFGYLNFDKFFNSISDQTLGKEVRKQFISDADYLRFNYFAKEYKKAGIKAITNPSAGNIINDLLISFMANAPAYGVAKTAWHLMRGSVDVAEKFYNDGFLRLAEKAETRELKRKALEAKAHYAKFLFNSVKKDGRFVSTPIVRNMMRTTLMDGTTSDSSTITSEADLRNQKGDLTSDFLYPDDVTLIE